MAAINFAPTPRRNSETLIGVAERMMREAGGDLDAATEKMTNYVLNKKRLTDEAVRLACRNLLGETVRSERRAIDTLLADPRATGPKAPASKSKSYNERVAHIFNASAEATRRRLADLGTHVREALLDKPYVIDGVRRPLRDHIGSDIVKYATEHMNKGLTMVRDGRFLIAVGNTAGNRKIGDAVTAEEAIRLRIEADKTSA
ncbi:hypothetical protein [Ancylobacter polymorphus]|uniref:Uncharacterized protein n=1 Tax=Ancylobacter polymorphus TaxID=223390 RepID=A0A9E6ZWG4_9HYPH|nr:hypothetical protein [Ancylobacter polymorphus]UOK71671.1 hypothetical protein K9D25_02810 [Ancylobacter polymorphus]